MKKEQKTDELDEKEVKDQSQAEAETEENTEEPKDDNQEAEEPVGKTDELSEMKDKYIRLYSEFDNFRKRTAKEKLSLIESANENLINELIPVLDDFERASGNAVDAEGALKEGFDLIYHKYKKVLANAGLQAMDCGKGSEFDPDFHEAISQIPAPEEELKGKIIDVVEKGYLLKEKVVRFAKVVVGS